MENIYWNNKGKHQELNDSLEKSMPVQGPCDTQGGELYRAASKVYYDHYNNGFGNDWREAAQFLMDNVSLSETVISMFREYGEGNVGSEPTAVEEMMDVVLEMISTLPEDQERKNDMWDTKFDKNWFSEVDYGDDDY